MEYPQEFIDECHRLYPGFIALHNALQTGSVTVGRYLDDNRMTISPEAVWVSSSFDELRMRAKQCIDRDQLYLKWCELYEAQGFPQ